MSVVDLVLAARQAAVEFVLTSDGGVTVRGAEDILAGWVDRLRPFKSEIRALLDEYEPLATRGDALEVALAAAAVAAAIGVLSVGGQLCSCCLRIDRCFEALRRSARLPTLRSTLGRNRMMRRRPRKPRACARALRTLFEAKNASR